MYIEHLLQAVILLKLWLHSCIEFARNWWVWWFWVESQCQKILSWVIFGCCWCCSCWMFQIWTDGSYFIYWCWYFFTESISMLELRSIKQHRNITCTYNIPEWQSCPNWSDGVVVLICRWLYPSTKLSCNCDQHVITVKAP